MDLVNAFRGFLEDARGLVDNGAVKAAITTDLNRLEALADQGMHAVEAHIARWFHGAYVTPDGGIVSPVDAAPAGTAAATPVDAGGVDVSAPAPAPVPVDQPELAPVTQPDLPAVHDWPDGGVVPPDQVAVTDGPAESTVTPADGGDTAPGGSGQPA